MPNIRDGRHSLITILDSRFHPWSISQADTLGLLVDPDHGKRQMAPIKRLLACMALQHPISTYSALRQAMAANSL